MRFTFSHFVTSIDYKWYKNLLWGYLIYVPWQKKNVFFFAFFFSYPHPYAYYVLPKRFGTHGAERVTEIEKRSNKHIKKKRKLWNSKMKRNAMLHFACFCLFYGIKKKTKKNYIKHFCRPFLLRWHIMDSLVNAFRVPLM